MGRSRIYDPSAFADMRLGVVRFKPTGYGAVSAKEHPIG